MADELPVEEVFAGVDGDAGEGDEGRGGAEEGVAGGVVDAGGVRVPSGEDGVEKGGVGCKGGGEDGEEEEEEELHFAGGRRGDSS